MVAVFEESAHRGWTTVPIFPSRRLLRLGFVLSGLLGTLAHAETTPSDRSEDRAAYNSAYLELGGSGFLWSANYDRMLGEHFSLRVGIEGLEFYGLCDCRSFFYVVPVTASALVFPGAHKFEIGLGATTFIGSTENGYKPAPIVWATGIIGYRYAPKHSGLMFRAGFTPFLEIGRGTPRPYAFPWAGLSVGYQF